MEIRKELLNGAKSEEQSKLIKYAPLIIGVLLGVISAVVGKLPRMVAQFSGMTVIGNHVGYLLGALLIAYLNSQKWRRSFILSSLTIIIASAVYYFLILIMRILGIGNTENLIMMATGLIFWSCVGIVCGALAATAAKLMTKSKSKLIRQGTLFATYLALLVVVYLFHVRLIINIYGGLERMVARHIIHIPIGGIAEVVFAVTLLTMLWIVSMRKIN